VKAAIVGGGIGGLTAAVALVRKGLDVVVLEQAPAIAPLGASLQLGPNATRLLDELGVLPALREIGVRPDAVEFLRWEDGSLLLRAEHGAAAEEHFGAPQLDFYRPDLHAALVAALPPGTVRLGARVERVEQGADRAVALLEGGERVAADVVVAADGLRSALRQQLVGADEPEFSGTVVYRGIAPYERVADLHPDFVNRYWLGPFRHGVSYRISRGRLLALNLGVQDAALAPESWTLETTPGEALAYLDGWAEPLRERLLRCDLVLRGAVFVRRPLDRWAFDRVALLGDAAHAMAPFHAQGAAQAVEDAYVLGECLAADDGDLSAGLRRYEQLRMSRAAELQGSSTEAARSLCVADGEEQRARDAAFSRLPETQPFGTRQRIWEHDVRDALAATRP
jgi:salicylate hydroxylase